MALRRPPTRIELSVDDISEYHDVSVLPSLYPFYFFLSYQSH
jgi:Anaphase-promoting complex APC subunit CDC26